jgi:N-acyl-D-aspartate/D-glutamate deacylase
MTSFAAGVLRISDRGTIRPDMKADLIVFDPAKVHARATYPDPLQFADGFDVVIVNGKVARENGRLAAEFHGRVLAPE